MFLIYNLSKANEGDFEMTVTKETVLDRLVESRDYNVMGDSFIEHMVDAVPENGIEFFANFKDVKLTVGQMITIKKGTRYYGTFPNSMADGVDKVTGRSYRVAKTTYKTKVHNVYQGNINIYNRSWNNPSILTVGKGGYFFSFDANVIPEACEE